MVLFDPRKGQGVLSDKSDGVGGRGSGLGLGSQDSGCLRDLGTGGSGLGSRVGRRSNGVGRHDNGNGDGGTSFAGNRGNVEENDSSGVWKEISGDGRCCSISVGTSGAASAMTRRDNTISMLENRDIGLNRSLGRGTALASRTFRKNQDMDMYRYEEELMFYDETLRKRTAIIDIIAIKDVVILRSNACLAAAFCRVTNKLLGFLNESRSESIEYLFYNKCNECLLMIVSSGGTDGSSKRCRELRIKWISRKDRNHRRQIFQDEDLSWPGFLHVDAINEVILIRSKSAYRIFDLKTYLFKYEFSATNVEGVLCRPQIFVVIYRPSAGYLPLRLKSAETGNTFIKMRHNIIGNVRTECLDLVNEKLLIKQSNKNLQVIDLIRSNQIEVEVGEFQCEPLPGRNMFLSFQHNSTEIRDMNGMIVRKLENHALYKINSIECNVCVTQEEDIVISTCINEGKTTESVKINCIDSGRLISTIDPNAKVTTLCYNADLGELYVGTETGRVLVWSV